MARILIVEDDPINAELVAIICKADRHAVTVVHDGREALRALDAAPYDLVLTDVIMPRMDGFTLVALIRSASAAYATIPIVVMTARSDASSVRALYDAGVQHVVAKPFRSATLRSAIDEVLAAGPMHVSIHRHGGLGLRERREA
jgi:CheY-like chemotaxis protein